MARLQRKSISKRTVEALSVDKDMVFWDSELPGFGVRVYPSGSKVYIAQTRAKGTSKRVTVGRHGVLTAEQARQRAALIIARMKAGEDPVPAPMASKPPSGPTVAEIAARYLEGHVAVRCKPSTAAQRQFVLRKHILPALGALPLAEVTQAHVADLHYTLRETPATATANAVVATLSRVFSMAEASGLVPEGGNPCRFVVKYRERKRKRFLSDEEFKRLGHVLREVEAGGRLSARAAAALRLLMLTGCRRNEIVTLHWADVDLDLGQLRLADTKTSARTVTLSPAAVDVLRDVPRFPGNPWVIAGPRPGTRITNLSKQWRRVSTRAALEDVRLHDLRHTWASRALALGESLPMIARLLGHSQVETTARYAHLARDSVHDAAARIAASIGADLLGAKATAVPHGPADITPVSHPTTGGGQVRVRDPD